MSAGRIEANKVIFQKLFSQDFWFVIPEYQRSYVWQTDNIIELVEDLYYAFENKDDSDYFLGSLVLKKIEFQSINFNKEEALTKQQLKTTKNIYNDIIKNFRKIANENNIAPSHKTGDFKIISIYKMVESEIKKQFDSEYQKLSQEEVNRIVLILINIYELEGDKALNEKIKTLKTVMTKDLKDFENHIPY